MFLSRTPLSGNFGLQKLDTIWPAASTVEVKHDPDSGSLLSKIAGNHLWNQCFGFVSYMQCKKIILLCFVADGTYYPAGKSNLVPLRRSKEVNW